MIRGLVCLCVVACVCSMGCGSSSEGSTDEKKMHAMLGGPPSMAGMAKKPKGAKQPAGGGGAASAPASGGSAP